jgi:hypothetical protein
MGNCYLVTACGRRPKGICPRRLGRSAGPPPRGDQGRHQHDSDDDANQETGQELQHPADSLRAMPLG